MTAQAGWLDRSRQLKMIVVLVSGRKVPPAISGVVGHRRLVEETPDRKEIAASDRSRSDEVFQRPGALDPETRIRKLEVERRPLLALMDPITDSGWRVREFASSEALDGAATGGSAAAQRHRRAHV